MKWSFCFVVLGILLTPFISKAQDKYAIAVGVESYSGFEPLNYSEDDAISIGKALKDLGFKTTVMTGQQRNSSLKPTNPKKILRVIRNRIESCGNGDTLIISLSGHGIQFSDEALLPSGVRETYFCPEDADKEDKATLIPLNETLIKMMNDCAATRKLLLIDACRNEILSPEAKSKGGKKLELEPVHESRRSIPGGMSVLFSCENKQFSWEHDKLGHSVFSNFVVKYLKGDAESRFYDKATLDLDGLVYYVRKQTNEYVFSNDLSPDGQIPILRGSSASWPIGKLPQVFAEEAHAAFEKLYTGFMDEVKAYNKAYNAASDSERPKLQQPDPKKLVPHLLKLADQYPGTEGSGNALSLAVYYGADQDSIVDRIFDEFADHEYIARLIPDLVNNSGTTKRLERLSSNSEFAEVRGVAKIALVLQQQQFRESRQKLERGLVEVTPSKAAEIRSSTIYSDERTVSLVNDILENHSDVEWQYPKYQNRTSSLKAAKMVEPVLFRIQRLSEGKQVPDIQGKDLDGVEFSLSDYRGKVILLDFYADW